MTGAALLLATLGLAGLLVAEAKHKPRWAWVFKPLASTGFILVAVSHDATATSYGQWILVALALSWWGDVLLIPRTSRRAFLAGMIAFALAHVAFAVAFVKLGSHLPGAALSGALLLAGALTFVHWLKQRMDADTRRVMGPAVGVYTVVIVLMTATSIGTALSGHTPWIFVGAAAFLCSDIAVALARFVTPGFKHRAWGLPLYYAAQCILASTVAYIV